MKLQGYIKKQRIQKFEEKKLKKAPPLTYVGTQIMWLTMGPAFFHP